MNRLAAFIHGENLPAAWQKSRLGNLGELYSGATPARSEGARLFGGGIPWVKTGDLNNSNLVTTEETLSQEGFDSCSCRLLPEESVLIAMYGGFGQIGRTGLLRVKATTNQAITALICRRDRAHPGYVLHWLNAYRFLWREYAGSSRKDPNITKSDIHAFPVALPPLPEQHKIANILGTWDYVLEKLDGLISAKSERNRELLAQLLFGKRPTRPSRTKWREHTLGDLLRTENRYQKWNENTVYKLAGVRRNGGGLFFRDSLPGSQIKVKTNKKLKNGDFLISRRQISYGGMAIVPPDFDGFDVNDEYEVLVIKSAAKLDIRYLGHLAKTRRFKHIAYLASNGFFAERLRLNFDLGAFLDSTIRIPESVDEQRRIVEILDTAEAELRLLRDQRDSIEKQKRGLMQKLLTGKVRVSA